MRVEEGVGLADSSHLSMLPNLIPIPSVRLSVCLSVRPSVCLSVCPSVCLSVCPSVCPSVRLFLSLSLCHCLSRALSLPPRYAWKVKGFRSDPAARAGSQLAACGWLVVGSLRVQRHLLSKVTPPRPAPPTSLPAPARRSVGPAERRAVNARHAATRSNVTANVKKTKTTYKSFSGCKICLTLKSRVVNSQNLGVSAFMQVGKIFLRV